MDAWQRRRAELAVASFGGFGAAEPAVGMDIDKANAAMVVLANEVVALFDKMTVKVNYMDPGVALRWLGKVTGAVWPMLDLITPNLPSPDESEEVARDGRIRALEQIIIKWGTTYRYWALNGKRDDGTPYTFDQWLGFLKELRGQIMDIDASVWDDNIIARFVAAMKAAGADAWAAAADAAKKGLGWLAWLEDNKTLILGVAGTGVLLMYFGPALGILATDSARRRAAR